MCSLVDTSSVGCRARGGGGRSRRSRRGRSKTTSRRLRRRPGWPGRAGAHLLRATQRRV